MRYYQRRLDPYAHVSLSLSLSLSLSVWFCSLGVTTDAAVAIKEEVLRATTSTEAPASGKADDQDEDLFEME
jgi:hypothetical protein